MARLGICTASRFGDIMAPPRAKAAKEAGEWSETARSYMLEKVSELLTGVPADTFGSQATRWGMEHEDEARQRAIPLIAERFGLDVGLPEGWNAFILHPTEPGIGCSPDGLIGDTGLLELKCPWNPVNHLRTVLSGEMPEKHREQVQGSLWCAERHWYVFGSYDPRVELSGMDPLWICKVDRDDAYIDKVLAPRVLAFRDWVMETYERLTGSKEPF